MTKITAAITAVGGYVPEYVLTNSILETMVDTNDEWITTRTGIKERHISTGEKTLDLAYKASLRAIESANIKKADIDLIIVATVTPDYAFPGVANLLQAKLKIKGATALAISGVLLGGSFALALKMVENVDPKTMLAFATSIGIFAGSLTKIYTISRFQITNEGSEGLVGYLP